MTPNDKLRATLRELRDACGDGALTKVYDELGAVGIGDVKDIPAAIELAEGMIEEAAGERRTKAKGNVQAELNAMADAHYSRKRRGASAE